MKRLLAFILLLCCSRALAQNAALDMKYYPKYYKAMEEPVISPEKTPEEVVRFMWLRTLGNPVMIKVVRHNGSTSVIWKRTDRQGGYEPGKLLLNESRTLSNKEWKKLLKLLKDEKFWELATEDKTFIGFDGTSYILEASMDGKYHVVDRWGGYHIGKICLYLFGLTDMDPRQDEIETTRQLLKNHPDLASLPDKDSEIEIIINELFNDPYAGYDYMIPKKYKEALKSQAHRDEFMKNAPERIQSGKPEPDSL